MNFTLKSLFRADFGMLSTVEISMDYGLGLICSVLYHYESINVLRQQIICLCLLLWFNLPLCSLIQMCFFTADLSRFISSGIFLETVGIV